MNVKKFDLFMSAIDDDLLEEAKGPIKRNKPKRLARYLALAACFCVVVGIAVWKSRPTEDGYRQDELSDTGTSAVETVGSSEALDEEKLAAMGYDFSLPTGATDVSYSSENSPSAPIMRASFTLDGSDYVCSMLKISHPSNIAEAQIESPSVLEWDSGSLSCVLENGAERSSVSWYSEADSTQWCLEGDNFDGLLDTSEKIVQSIGYDVAVAPAGASDMHYRALKKGGLLVGESTFRLGEVNCAFRMAATGEIREYFFDISDTGTDYDHVIKSEVSYCPARIYYNDAGDGKVVWFDVVPGLLYSYSMDSGATEESLLVTANELFVPAQGDC